MMKKTKTVIAALFCSAIPVLANDLVKPIPAQSPEIQKDHPSVGEPRPPVNPFTGHAAAFETNSEELVLAKQRRAIAEQRLAEQRALADIDKIKRDAANTVGNVKPSIVANADAMDQKSKTDAPSKTKRTKKPTSFASVKPPMMGNFVPVVLGPTLIGVTESGGRRYALFESNGKSLTIPEGTQEGGIAVGEIKGREVVVNGVMQSVNVGAQEVAYLNDPLNGSDVGQSNLFPVNRPGSVYKDMATLRLPAVSDVKPIVGPQPLSQ